MRDNPMATSSSFLNVLDSWGIKYGSYNIVWNEVTQSKKMIFDRNMGWDSPYDSKKNGVFIKTGKETGLCVIDLDDMTNEDCNIIQKICKECCNLQVKTRRGYHYYFKYADEFPTTVHSKNHGFDIISGKAVITCPPSWYIDELGTKWEYSIECLPDDEINSMPSHLVELLVGYINKPIINAPIQSVHIGNIPTTCSIKRLSYGQVKYILENLDITRAENYCDWIRVGFILKNEGYSYYLWEMFSNRSRAHTNDSRLYYQWNNIKAKQDNECKLTVKTLLYWLNIDNKEAYNTLTFESQ